MGQSKNDQQIHLQLQDTIANDIVNTLENLSDFKCKPCGPL